MSNQAKQIKYKKADKTREGSFNDRALKLSGLLTPGLPHSKEIEHGVIGAMIQDKNAFALVDFLKENDFYLEKTRLTFNAIAALNSKSKPIDLITVVEQLKRDGVLGSKIEPTDIVDFTNKVANSANIEYHARLLNDLKFRRLTITDTQTLLKESLDQTVDIFELRNKAQRKFITVPPIDLFEAKTANQSMEDARYKKPRKKYCGDLIKEKEVVFLFGDNGSGKSVLSVQVAQSIAAGKNLYPFLENEAGPQKVLYYDFEVDDIGFLERYSNISQNITADSSEFRDFQFHDNFIRVTLNEDYLDFEEDAEKEIFTKMERDVISHEASVVIVDNISYLSTEDLQEAKASTAFMKKVIRLRKKFGLTIILIGHNTKITKGVTIEKEHMGGSKQLSNLADAMITVGKSSREESLRYIKSVKRRYGTNTFYTENVILTSIVKEGEFLKHEYMETGDEMHHLTVLDKTDIDGLKSSVVQEWKQTGSSPRKIKKRLNLEQSHPTIRKWIKEYQESEAKLEALENEDMEYEDPKETAFWGNINKPQNNNDLNEKRGKSDTPF